MTNRDYLMRLSDRDLAEYMNGDRICDCLTKCPECNCTDCITEWLKAERKPDVKKKADKTFRFGKMPFGILC